MLDLEGLVWFWTESCWIFPWLVASWAAQVALGVTTTPAFWLCKSSTSCYFHAKNCQMLSLSMFWAPSIVGWRCGAADLWLVGDRALLSAVHISSSHGGGPLLLCLKIAACLAAFTVWCPCNFSFQGTWEVIWAVPPYSVQPGYHFHCLHPDKDHCSLQ